MKTKTKEDNIKRVRILLMGLLNRMGMETPENFPEIVQYCYEQIDQDQDWNVIDVLQAFTKWVENVNGGLHANAYNVLKTIDYGLLREQKTVIINIFNWLILKDDQKNALNSILSLLDNIQDFAVDEMGMDEMFVFDLDAEDPDGIETEWCIDKDGVEHIVPKPTYTPPPIPEPEAGLKSVFLCANCASDNIQFKAWVNPNAKEEVEYFIDDPKQDNYCNDCGKHGDVFTDDMDIDKHVIGYQVIHVLDEPPVKTEFHPLHAKDNQVFNLKQANEMISDNVQRWQLFTIWSGDFEEPMMMFEGDCR